MSRANRFKSKVNAFESIQKNLIPHFFWDIIFSDTRHVPTRIILQLSVYLSQAFFRVKCNGDNIIRHVADGRKYCFSNFCLGSVLG